MGFTYDISDGNGGTATASVSITVTPAPVVNGVPVAANDNVSTAADTAVVVNVLGNDTDPDGDSLTVTSVSNEVSGTAVINAAGSAVSFTPASSFSGQAGFSYVVSDGNGGTDTASVVVTVTPAPVVNGVPVAVDDSVSTPEGTAIVINVLGNDTDPDGDSLTVTSVSNAVPGVATINAAGSAVTYTPPASFSGQVGFTYVTVSYTHLTLPTIYSV